MRDLYSGAAGAGLIYACFDSCIFLLRVCRLFSSRQGGIATVAAVDSAVTFATGAALLELLPKPCSGLTS